MIETVLWIVGVTFSVSYLGLRIAEARATHAELEREKAQQELWCRKYNELKSYLEKAP